MIRGTTRNIKPRNTIDTRINIHNRFDIEIVDSKTGAKRAEARAYNVVCNNLWNELNKSHTTNKHKWFHSITYGRGTGTPSADDTDLFDTIASKTASDLTYGWDYENAVCWIRKSIHIDELTSNGETITEIGIRSYGGVLCTHAMLQDMNGNQISIEKGDTDILNIYATVYVHVAPELVDVNNPVQVDLTTIENANSFLRWLAGDVSDDHYGYGGLRMFAPIKGRITGNDNYLTYSGPPFSTIDGVAAYDSGSRIYTLTGRCPYNVDNDFGGFGWWAVCSKESTYGGLWNKQIAIKAAPPVFSGSVVKDEPVGTGDGVTVDFATKFDYPANAKVYVNSELCVDATVDVVPLCATLMGQYFECIDVVDGKAYPIFNRISTYGYGMAMGIVDRLHLGSNVNYFYNPNWQYGISQFGVAANGSTINSVAISDDLVNWHYLYGSETSSGLGGKTVTVPEEHRYKKYWRFMLHGMTQTYANNFVATDLTGYNIHFATPPAEGAVITIDYDTRVIAKDINHVFDLSLTVHLGEYSES